jgi:hypothetical protein
MSRSHEDLRRHTPTDHRAGGPVITFAPNSWWAIGIVNVTGERAPAGITSYETLIEKARVSAPKAREAAVFESHNRRRVIVLLHLNGHEAFNHLAAAWDDHHLFAERHAVAESHSLALYRLAANAGEAAVDPASNDAYAFEHLSLGAERTRALIAPIVGAPGFRGASLFDADGDTASAILYRFALGEEIDAFRATPAAHGALGPTALGETFYAARPVRTFA